MQDVLVPVASLITSAAVLALASVVLTVTVHRAGTGWPAVRGWALTSAAVVGAGPTVAVMYGVRHAASSRPAADTRGEQVGVLVALRRLLQRLLTAAGSLVALSTLAMGASLAAQQNPLAGCAHSAGATATTNGADLRRRWLGTRRAGLCARQHGPEQPRPAPLR